MDYRKKYENALEKAKSLYNSMFVSNDILEQIFPELKESEEEQHRRWILEYLYDGLSTSDEEFKEQFKAAIDWFEKHVNAAGIIKPKFRTGDYIKHNKFDVIARVLSINDDFYYIEPINAHKGIKYFDVEQNFHLWSLQDAKDGCILVKGNEPFIYNGKFDSMSVGAYCGINVAHKFKASENPLGCNWTENKNIVPATREQHDFLFEKMKEAGYLWDNDNKKLIDFNKQNE